MINGNRMRSMPIERMKLNSNGKEIRLQIGRMIRIRKRFFHGNEIKARIKNRKKVKWSKKTLRS